MLNKVIIVSPHPDDETLGAGGTILKYKSLGYKVYWLNVTNMAKKHGFKEGEVQKRKNEIKRIINEYKFDGFFDLGLKPFGLDEYPLSAIIEKISKVLVKVKPEIIILPYKNDIHSDHRIVFECAYACTKVFRYPYIRKILMTEIISETNFSTYDRNFSPNYFVNISDYLEKKIKIMRIYKNELENHPFPRSTEALRALATIRGGQAGCKYAESFMILKEIWHETGKDL